MSRFNRASSVVQQEKEKIILINGVGAFFRTRMGLVRFNNQNEYDPTFDTMDPTTKVAFTTGLVNDIAIDTSLNVYVGGSFTSFRSTTNNRIMKLLPTGAKDVSFNNTTGFNSTVNRLLLDNNNKLYCFGSFTTYKGVTANRIIRLDSNGSKDVGFDNTTGFNSSVEDVAFDSLGRIYCIGNFISYKGNTCNRIVRINTDGSYDNTFVIGTGFNNPAYSIFIDSSDKIFIGGPFSTYNGISANGIVKLNSDGSIDTSFDYGTGFLPLTGVNQIMCDEIGNVYVSVNNDNSVYKNTTTPYGLWKIDASGNFVSSLNTPSNVNGTIPLYVINSENIIYTKENSLCILNSIGNVKKVLSIDPSVITGVKLDLSGNTYLRGGIDNFGIFDRSFTLGLPLGEDGLIKPEKFNQNRGRTTDFGSPSFSIKNLTKDNKLIFMPCNSYNGVPKKDILKLTLNGSLDNEFDTGTGFQSLSDYAVDTDTLGNIYIITNSPNYKGETFTLNPGDGVLIKIKKNGDRDTSFIPVVISTSFIETTGIYVQPDNKVIMIYNQGAQFNLSGQTYNGIIRFNTNGGVDNTFSGGTWSNPFGSTPGISKSFLHTDGKLYLRTSNFPNLTYNGVSVGEFVRLNNDGSLDNTFVTNAVNTSVEGLLVDKYDKVWIWGGFTSYSGVTNNRILRLNNDGTIDNAFNNSIGFNNNVSTLAYDNDTDKVYCIGSFLTYKTLSYRYLISLNYDGTINTTFSVSPKNNNSGSDLSISILKL